MNVEGAGALIAGGASGLGAAATRALHAAGATVVIADLNEEKGAALVAELGERARFLAVNVTDEDGVQAAVDAAGEAQGGLRISVCCAGIGWVERTSSRQGAHNLEYFSNVVKVNLIGTFNVLRLAATAMNANEPNKGGERGVCVNTASVAAFEGQIGLFDTPLLAALPEDARTQLGRQAPFPARLGMPAEFAQLVTQIVENPMLNGTTIRLDGALRMPLR